MSWSQADDDKVSGTALCDICEPWVEYSRARTNKFPEWARTLVHDDPGLIDETRAALEKIVHQNHNAQWGPRGQNGHNQLGPHNDWAWLEFIEWCVGRGHPEIIDGFNHAEARENDGWMSDELDTVASITEWFNHIRREAEDTTDAFSFTSEEGFIYAETHSLGDHEIVVHDSTILVDGVEFGDQSGENYWLDPEILPELLSKGGSPKQLVKARGLGMIGDPKVIEEIIDKLILNHPNEVESFRAGKKKLLGFFVGQLMKETKGKADPKLANQILNKKLQC